MLSLPKVSGVANGRCGSDFTKSGFQIRFSFIISVRLIQVFDNKNHHLNNRIILDFAWEKGIHLGDLLLGELFFWGGGGGGGDSSAFKGIVLLNSTEL